MMGYEGYAKISGTRVLCTSASIPRQRNRIDSSAAYGGKITGITSNIAILGPKNYDWDTYEGSIDYEFQSNMVSTFWGFLVARQSTINIEVAPLNSLMFTCNQSYWNSLTLSASNGSAITSSIGFKVVSVNNIVSLESADVDYKDNKWGLGDSTDNGMSPFSPNNNPIPYWNSEVEYYGENVQDWALDFSQDVQFFFVCQGNSAVQQPKFIAAGPMTAGLSLTTVPFSGNMSFNDFIDTLSINIGSAKFKLKGLTLNSVDMPLVGQSDIVSASVKYDIYLLDSFV